MVMCLDRTRAGVTVLVCFSLLGGIAEAKNAILFDFETGVEGWENEVDKAATPAPAELSNAKARSGTSSLSFKHYFTKGARTLHCRTKDGFQKDLSDPRFLGFSAWVFIPNGLPHWEIKMFVRSGPAWSWAEGKVLKDLQPGWYRVEIGRDKIQYPGMIQDLGIDVMNFLEDIESTIYIDRVETVIQDAPPSGADAPNP